MTYDANASPVEDRDEAARARAKLTVSERERKWAAPHREGPPFANREGPPFFVRGAGASPSDEGAGISETSGIPPLPSARPIPGHEHHPGPEDHPQRGRQHARRRTVTADQPTLPVEDEGGEPAAGGWSALISRAAAVPFAAIRFTFHGVSRAGRRFRHTLHTLEDRGEHVWRDWLGHRRA